MEGGKRGRVRREGEIDPVVKSLAAAAGRRRLPLFSFLGFPSRDPHGPADLPRKLRESGVGRRFAFESKGIRSETQTFMASLWLCDGGWRDEEKEESESKKEEREREKTRLARSTCSFLSTPSSPEERRESAG